MEGLIDLARLFTALAYGGVALAAFAEWRRRRGAAPVRMAAMFAVLAFVAFSDWALPQQSAAPAVVAARKVYVAVLGLYPYFLYRFMSSFVRPPRWLDRIVEVLTLGAVAGGLLVSFPRPGRPRPDLFQTYLYFIAVQWVLVSATVVQRLWQAGRGQPTVARRRMRTLSLGSLGITVALILAGAPIGENPAASLAVRILALASAPFFLLGFAPPAPIRMAWRRPEEASLREAQRELMGAVAPADVAGLLPHVSRVFGGRGAVLGDLEGRVVAAEGLGQEEAESVASLVAAGARAAMDAAGVIAVPFTSGWLAVQASPYMPFFGTEEIGRLRSLAVLVDLALARVDLLWREREARAGLEAANADLEAFLYGVSHDLKSPLVSLTGYLGYLRKDYGDMLPERGHERLEGMSAGVMRVETLIHDLLELSRIGRFRTEPERLDPAPLAREIADELSAAYPGAAFEIGPLPPVTMNPLRARQLLTNLMENAARHAGRADVRVRVGAGPNPDGTWDLWVADNGRGIPPEHRGKAFGPFERLGEGNGSTSGTGMGLAVCQKIVEVAGGSIRIADSSEGAEVRITLPARVVGGDG